MHYNVPTDTSGSNIPDMTRPVVLFLHASATGQPLNLPDDHRAACRHALLCDLPHQMGDSTTGNARIQS